MVTLYLNEQESIVKKQAEYLIVQYPDKHTVEVPLIKVSQVVVSGNVTLTTPALHTLLEAGIEVCFLSMYGQFRGRLSPPMAKNALVRCEQYRAHFDAQRALEIARACVKGKLENMRTMLMRANRSSQDAEITAATLAMQTMIQQIPRTTTVGSLLGLEGNGSASYFAVFGKLLRDPMTFTRRRRRPPLDPINAMLSLGYTLLLQQVSSAIEMVGLDPYVGFLHQPRYGRPALALDLMEEFRPIIADSVVLNIINRRMLTAQDFQEELGGAVYLRPEARKTFYARFEERLQDEIQHPHFGYRTSYRRCMELQVRLLGKWLTGEIPAYLPLNVR
ncbi:MAG TPA: type I-D CRISPR-associated endonuclease Cas1d [Ktedonobacteraceae bacterium]|nr:type I-D CRISPR-associated endonuclease Cas1d [Ktedonobacteraceae bacterium]